MANENYIKSSDIRIYPSGFRGVNSDGKVFDPEAYLNTEANLTGFIRRMSFTLANGDGSFVVKYSPQGTGASIKEIEIVVFGYWFDFDLMKIPTFDEGSDLYACIKLRSSNIPATGDVPEYSVDNLSPYETTGNIDQLVGDEYRFLGMYFSTSEPTDSTVHYLKIWEGAEKGVPASSMLRFKSEHIEDSSGKSISDSLSLKEVLIAEDGSLTANNLTANQSVGTDKDRKLMSKDLSFSDPSAMQSTSTSFSYITGYKQDSVGIVDETVVKKETSKVEESSTQGNFRINSNEIRIKDLQIGSSPTFAKATFSENVIQGSYGNSATEYSLPKTSGTLATIKYDSGSDLLTINTATK